MKSRATRLAVLIVFAVALGVTAYLFRASGAAASGGVCRRTAFRGARARGFAERARSARRAGGLCRGRPGGRFLDRPRHAGAERPSRDSDRASQRSHRAGRTNPNRRGGFVAAGLLGMDVRARDYVRAGQKLLASDLIFSNGLELTDSIVTAIDKARAAETLKRQTAAATFERRQRFALTAAAAAALLVALLLLPRVEVEAIPGLDTESPAPAIRPALVPKPEPLGHTSEGDGWTPARRAGRGETRGARARTGRAHPPAEPAAVVASETVRAPRYTASAASADRRPSTSPASRACAPSCRASTTRWRCRRCSERAASRSSTPAASSCGLRRRTDAS